MTDHLIKKIKSLARTIGYDACGITAAEPFNEFARSLDEHISLFPETRDLYEEMYARVDPCKKTPWIKSIIVCVRWYGKYKIPEGLTGHIGRNYLFDRRYSGCPDHDMPKKLKAGLKELGLRVKTGGVPDRWTAARAGVARFGKNCFVYSNNGKGSWINIESFCVDAELMPDKPTLELICPKDCHICMDKCPTNAIVKPFMMRMDRCIAYLTYSAPEPIPDDLWKKMGPWIYGCDICQKVCPKNKNTWEFHEEAAWLKDITPYISPDALASMDEKTYHNIIHPAFWYIPKENIARWHKNAARALKYQASK